MALIEIFNLSKSFGNVVAVDAVTMEVAERSFTSFLGPSGCGKTTLLRMIVGLEEPDEGEIIVGGKTIFSSSRMINISPKDRKMGLVFQSYALWPHMKVFDNIAYGLKVKGVPRQDIEERIDSLLAMMEMKGLENRYPSELSGGQQQRVSVARMLSIKPQILLMDEPLSNLDAKLRLEMRSELKRIHRETGITIIYVTHDQMEAFGLSTHVAVMNEGRIQQVDSPTNIYMHPQNLFVAGFIGTPLVNLMPGKVANGENRKIEMEGEFGLIFPKGTTLKDSQKVVVAARVEDLKIRKGRRGKDEVEYLVEEILMSGSDILLTLKRKASTLLVRVGHSFSSSEGDKVYVDFNPSKCNIYDKETGNILTRK